VNTEMNEAAVASRITPAAAAPTPWLVSPVIDALFVANLLWPLIWLVPQSPGYDGHDAVHFWQLYFLTTPHRWITLLFVLLDGDQLRDRRAALLIAGGSILAACGLVRFGTGDITCLLAIDYVWNAWHFAAQHHGVYRVYDRLSGPPVSPPRPPLWAGEGSGVRVLLPFSFLFAHADHNQITEAPSPPALLPSKRPARGASVDKWALRGFLLYVILRIAGGTWSWPQLDDALCIADFVTTAVPILLVGRELWSGRPARTGARLYLISVCTLYLSLLWAVHERQPRLVLTLATASALFHAIEYLTLVGWTVRQHHSAASDRSFLARLAPRWGIAIGLFALIQGSAGWLLERNLLEVWLFANVVMAFLHYAFDGIIWRRRHAKV
jgi:hypothetical protein